MLKQSVSNWSGLSAVIPGRAPGAPSRRRARRRCPAMPSMASARWGCLRRVNMLRQSACNRRAPLLAGPASRMDQHEASVRCGLPCCGVVRASRRSGLEPKRARAGRDHRARSLRSRKGTRHAAAWNAFLATFPNGFYADLARAYLKNLAESGGGAAAAPAATPVPAGSGSAPAETPKVNSARTRTLTASAFFPMTAPGIGTSRKRRSTATLRASSRGSATNRCIPISVPCGGRADRHPLYRRARHAEKVPVAFKDADESDPGPYPIRPTRRSKAGRTAMATATSSCSIATTGSCTRSSTFSGAQWRLEGRQRGGLGPKKNQVRPDRWTSADAAGLPILPGLVRYDEVVGAQAVETRCASRLPSRAAPTCRPRAIGRATPRPDPSADGHARAAQGGLRHCRLRPSFRSFSPP